ncbi:MAG: HAD-IA family hydrolase, partial [Hypericibacter sp.]
RQAFAFACREGFLAMMSDVIRGERPWMTADQIFAAVMAEQEARHGLTALSARDRRDLDLCWRRMPAWPGAREAIAALRQNHVVVPLTILSWNMAVGSSRRNGIAWDSILSCDILGLYKPDPRCYARAVEILACAPQEIMMVAAHPSDLRAGMVAGFRAAYVMPRLQDPGEDYSDTGFEAEFDLVARDFSDLAKQLA